MEQFEALPLPHKVLMVFLALASIAGVFYFVLIGDLEAEIASSQAKVRKTEQAAAQLKRYENKDLMASNDVNTIFHLAKFVPCSHDKITQQVLRLLFNLSFDKSCRTKMVEVGFLPKLVDLLKKAPFRAKTVSREEGGRMGGNVI